MSRFYSRLFLPAFSLFSVLVSPVSAQQTGVDPKITQTHTTPEDRSYKAMEEWVEKKYAGTPVRGNHKRALRTLHYWERRLDTKGNVFNHVRANLQELEQLYIDTFPALIQGDWQHIGPLDTYGNAFNQEGVGRISQIYFASAGTWYAATAGGGLWRTDLAGIYPGFGDYPWFPLTDSLPVMSISGIEVHPDNVDDIYILTGDGNSSSTFPTRGTQPGIGILHSTNGGITWDPSALSYTETQLAAGFKLIRYPESIDTMFAACTDGLYRTNDGWIASATQIVSDTCYDIEFKPDDPQTVYAAFDGILRRSTDGGVFFQQITANLVQTNITPATVMGRIAIAVTPDNPDLLYVVIAKESDGGLASFQVSYDGGDSFVELVDNGFNLLASNDPETETDGQGNYDLGIWADPNNANTVIVGGVNLWKSTSGGINWTQLVHWTDEPPEYTHADIHVIESNPFNGDIVVGSDGGVYASSDGGVEWGNRGRGLGITQFYHLDVWIDFLGLPFVSGGSQDNGTSAGLGLSDPTFEMVGGGDGFRTYRGTSDGDHMRYRSSQNGRLFHQLQLAGFWDESEITPDEQLDDNDDGKGLWDTPYQPNPNNFDELLAGYDNLYYGWDNGDDWLRLDYPNSAAYDGTRLIRQIAWSKLNGNTIFFYVADTTRRHLYKCETFYASVITGSLEQASCTIQNLDTIANLPTGSNSGLPTDLALSGLNTDEVWMSFAGYTDSMKVLYNQDITTGQPWMNISYNLPNTPVHCVEWDIDGIFAGTDIGVFFLRHGEVLWVYFSRGLPTVAVTEIEVHNTASGKLVFASTWGRGIWWSTAPAPMRQTRWYVDSGAAGSNTGIDWANAFTELQSALDAVVSGDSIWVAAGTYYPPGANGFALNWDNVYIFGGFNGTEDSVIQRDFILNHAILSGDIGVPGDSLDNAKHVFIFSGQNDNVLLDGFHITAGYANGVSGNDPNGGGILYDAGSLSGKPVIRNCRFYNNSCTGLGGAMFIGDYQEGDPEIYISSCTFENNFSPDRGGALYMDVFTVPLDTGAAAVFLDSCTFNSNHANNQGGAIFLEASRTGRINLTLRDCTFDGNTLLSISGKGAALSGDVFTNNGNGIIDLECKNTRFLNHSANSSGDGGAIYFNGQLGQIIAVFDSCTFEDNQANLGGAVMNFGQQATSSASFNFNHCTFNNNEANFQGGAVHLNSDSDGNTVVNFNACTFTGNSSVREGGAIYYQALTGGHITTDLDSCTFFQNQSTTRGAGAINLVANYVPGSLATADMIITNSVFEQNSASGGTTMSGGAIVINNQRSLVDLNISHTDFIDNLASGHGGAVAHVHSPSGDSSGTTALYTQCTFERNTATFHAGGALSFNGTHTELTECTFTENQARFGGAIRYWVDSGPFETYTYTLNNNTFNKNRATEAGGALHIDFDDPPIGFFSMDECLFDSNYTTSATFGRGAAIYITGEAGSLYFINNSDFMRNRAMLDGGAIYLTNDVGMVDTCFVFADSCSFTDNDAAMTSESVEIFGNNTNARIFTRWQECEFNNDGASTMFLNRRSGSGVLRTVMNNCTYNLMNGSMQNAQSSPEQYILFQDE